MNYPVDPHDKLSSMDTQRFSQPSSISWTAQVSSDTWGKFLTWEIEIKISEQRKAQQKE